MEPTLPEQAGELSDLALEVVKRSARTAGHVHPLVLRELIELLRVVNSYYSNLIEGHKTRPYDIERAMRADYASDPARRALQQESLAHIEVQRLIEARLAAEPDLPVAGGAFLCWVHREFYERLPPTMRRLDDPHGRSLEVVPGRLRERLMEVGVHVAPDPQALPRFLARFEEVYDPGRHHGDRRLIAAAHHRLAWIHPFLDGNGRVARLFSDAYLVHAGVDGYGLWSISRGLARRVGEYKQALAGADQQRRDAYDGRGNLTMAGLRAFCRFFLEVCLDQATYMSDLLRLDALAQRLAGYLELRAAALLPGQPPLRREATRVLQLLLVRGELARGEAAEASGLKERTARALLAELLAEGLLRSDSPKGPVRPGFPLRAVPYLFAGLFPGD